MQAYQIVTRRLLVVLVVLCLVQTTRGQNDLQPFNNGSSSNGLITCCYTGPACDPCTNLFKVNGIVYCCPFCMGLALVTDLRCGCFASPELNHSLVTCVLTDQVVGGYIAWRSNFFYLDANVVKSTTLCLLLAFLVSFWHTFIK